jgi:hypothetical protein
MMPKSDFTLRPLLDYRRSLEEQAQLRVRECAEACARAYEAWQRAVADLQVMARDRAVLEKLQQRRRDQQLKRERRREEEA